MPRETKKVLPELQWFNKKRKLCEASSDAVSIRVASPSRTSKADHRRLTFIFRDKLYENFNSRYITFAVIKNRIYFKSVEAIEGYAITIKGLSGYVQCTVTPDELKQFELFIGNHSLKYDEFYELYYIEKEM